MTELFEWDGLDISGYPITAVDVLSILSVITSILIITTKNPIVSVLYLIGLFVYVSVILMLINVNYIALSYILVYIGAVSILFLFILMLINIRISEIISYTYNSTLLAILVGSLFITTIKYSIPNEEWNIDKYKALKDEIYILFVTKISDSNIYNITNNIHKEISLALSNYWENSITYISHITGLGNILYTNYPMLLVLTGVILLLCMVGSIVITVKPVNN